jgi:hypothetical protein
VAARSVPIAADAPESGRQRLLAVGVGICRAVTDRHPLIGHARISPVVRRVRVRLTDSTRR